MSKSSRDWYNRQIRDPYVKKAKQDGWRSRAVYKLEEINNKGKVIFEYKDLDQLNKILDIIKSNY